MSEYLHPTELDQFVAGYLECAAWCTIDWPEDQGTDPTGCLDRRDDLTWSPKALEEITEECADFVDANYEDLQAAADEHGMAWVSLGHDFMLTRNGHGAGFWDRGMGALGERLSDAGRVYGETNYWADDDDVVQIG